jgi:hypothetical protein
VDWLTFSESLTASADLGKVCANKGFPDLVGKTSTSTSDFTTGQYQQRYLREFYMYSMLKHLDRIIPRGAWQRKRIDRGGV